MSGSVGNNPYRASGVVASLAAAREGTVDWDTSIHTGTVTAASGSGYFVNTTSGGITVNLPAAAVGSIVAVSDYASTAASNNITVAPNGSDKINGTNDSFKISTAGLAVTLVYADATRGWKSVTGSDEDATGVTPAFVAASGGDTTITSGDYKIHVFTGDGALCVSAVGNCAGSKTVDYLIVAGGAGGGKGSGSAGGGAGGYRYSYPNPATGGTAVSVQPYTITVGGGGAGSTSNPSKGTSGGASSGFCISSAGGGGGGSGVEAGGADEGGDGGSGGGGAFTPGNSGGTGNTPPVSPPQGKDGGLGGTPGYAGGGGGGATVAGSDHDTCNGKGGDGGPIADAFFGPTAPSYGTPGPASSTRYFAGGGGGGRQPASPPPGGAGGAGGGGAGEFGPPDSPGVSGTAATGGGGGGSGGPSGNGGTGGDGVVAIRYKFQ